MTHHLPEGFKVRPATDGDLGSVAELIRAVEMHELNDGSFTDEDLALDWRHPGLDLATDAITVVAPDGLVCGYIDARSEGDAEDAEGFVHPNHHGQGIGTTLLDFAERRVKERLGELGRRSAALRTPSVVGITGADRFLSGRGYTVTRHFLWMGIDLDNADTHVDPPAGVTIETVVAGLEEPMVHGIIQEAFSEHWGFSPEPFERWSVSRNQAPGHDPEMWLVARDRGTPVGAILGYRLHGKGWIGEIGVVASHRGRGIGEALMKKAFATFRDKGLGRAGLNVDETNTTGATRLYERVGMSVTARFKVWEKQISAG